MRLLGSLEPELGPAVARALAESGLSTESPPSDREDWKQFLTNLAAQQSAPAAPGGMSFKELFRESPAPTMAQDYTDVVEWMAELRLQGVADLAGYLAGRPDRLAAAVSRIRITAINPAGVEVIGKPRDEVMGPVDPAIINEGSHVSWTRQLETVWTGQRSALIEFNGAHADGSVFDARLTMVIPEERGRPDYSRVVVTIHDITEQRSRERDMQHLAEARMQLLASVSHEVRTPLSAVVGYAQVLRSEGEAMAAEDREAMTAVLHRQAQDVAHMVDDLLVSARADLGHLAVECEEIDVLAEVAAVVAGLDFAGERISPPDPAERDLYCSGDPARFRQIVRNLLTNAQRYGGPKIEIRLGEDVRHIIVKVCDDGDGLPPGDAERAFRPYERTRTARHSADSVGIGLSISRKLAELMEGDLRYLRDGGWTVFQLRMPRILQVPGGRSGFSAG